VVAGSSPVSPALACWAAGSRRSVRTRTYVRAMREAHSLSDVRTVFRLKAAGLTDRDVSRRSGIPITTIRAWRYGRLPAYAKPTLSAARVCRGFGELPDFSSLPREWYSYLLGVYLGDGCLARNGQSWMLRVVLDVAYPGIIAACCDAIESVAGGERPMPRPDASGKRCVTVSSTWWPWACLFPQHGPGRKHNRTIELADWQQEIVDIAPGAFLRGLIHTDGWRGLNRVHVKGKDYAYPRYQFSNRSDDIRKLFTDTCDKLGVHLRQWTRYHVSVAQRESVALLDSFIGPKL
jgi:hypothetical protein